MYKNFSSLIIRAHCSIFTVCRGSLLHWTAFRSCSPPALPTRTRTRTRAARAIFGQKCASSARSVQTYATKVLDVPFLTRSRFLGVLILFYRLTNMATTTVTVEQ
jgi:hypothetical protein